jgi:hypothetical protein
MAPTATAVPPIQRLTIRCWHPTTNPNGSNSKGHWSTIRRRHDVDRDMAWASARQAGWVFVPGKVRLTITFVYPRKYRIDADNLAARCKGLIDGLNSAARTQKIGGTMVRTLGPGFFTDDSTEWLDLHVDATVERGVKETRLTLESLGG